jgi:hypothetical protein
MSLPSGLDEPGTDNQLTGKSSVTPSADVLGAVKLTAPDGKAAQGQFK